MEDLKKKLLSGGNENKIKSVHVSAFPEPVLASPVTVPASPISVKLSTYDGKPTGNPSRHRVTEFELPIQCSGSSVRPEILQGIRTSADENKTPENRRKLAGIHASEIERLANLAFSDHPATVRETISVQYFVDGLKEGEIQKAVRMADVQDLKSALLYALKVEATNEASYRDSHSVRGARVATDAPCESPWRKEIEKLRKEIQNLMAQRQNLRRRRITCGGCNGAGHLRSSCPRINKEDHNIKCWGCGRAGHVRSNCPRMNQEDPCRASVTESKKVCSNRKGSEENGDIQSKRPFSESSKNLSNSLRVEKKFGVIDPVVRQHNIKFNQIQLVKPGFEEVYQLGMYLLTIATLLLTLNKTQRSLETVYSDENMQGRDPALTATSTAVYLSNGIVDPLDSLIGRLVFINTTLKATKQLFDDSLTVEKNVTIYDGEVFDVCETATQLLSAGLSPAKTVFFVDSQAAISVLKINSPTGCLDTIQCRAIIAELISYCWTVALLRVPSNARISGNDRTNQKSTQGAESS
ncbi:uncharacterized protein TNCV_2126001 [Trichonephila clavipes]|nr:uncharacterized protein TNCV_2126001 [Trichonephila clavipes]